MTEEDRSAERVRIRRLIRDKFPDLKDVIRGMDEDCLVKLAGALEINLTIDVRCPMCGHDGIQTYGWQIEYRKEWYVGDDCIEGKNSDFGPNGIHPLATATCQDCEHSGDAKTFQFECETPLAGIINDGLPKDIADSAIAHITAKLKAAGKNVESFL